MYKDQKLRNGATKRVISESIASEESAWHRDENDRIVVIMEGEGWSFQRDNSLPVTVSRGDVIHIGGGEWHRVIPGSGDLTLAIRELALPNEEEAEEEDPRVEPADPDKLLFDLIKEIGEEIEPLDLDGTEMVDEYQTADVEDFESEVMISEDDLVEALLILREGKKKKSDHEPGYKAPEGSARDRKLDAAKAAYKSGDVQAAIRIRDEMEKQAREKSGYKTRKSKYTDETKQPANYPPVMSELDELENYDEDAMCEGLGAKTREALKKKAESSNAPLGALIAVYKKGLGAFYSSGSRPGMTAHQWAMARTNSFLKGGKARQVDAAQWKQVQKFRKKN
jgi:mannose-6-phosphate isomerase-like protein (cupin superfamily)